MLIQKMPAKTKLYSVNSGTRKKAVYKYAYDEAYGCPRRVLNGYTDFQDYIQASADDVDFNAIGKMLVDTTQNVVGHFKVEGKTFDMTGVPRNIHEFDALHNKIKAEFDGFPVDIKNLFGNKVEDFKRAYLNGSIGSIMDAYYKSKIGPAKTVEQKEGDK